MEAWTSILLIDDQVDRASVRRALAKSGLDHELVEAVDGTSGLERASERTFDCVLLDYRLPDIDAFELLAKLLSPEGGSQPVLMLTGEADQDVAFRLMLAGALDYLAKAEATPSSLARAIRYARARRGFLAELEAAQREAEEKSAALEVLDRQKSLLFSIIAHDLRNPFQAILGLSDRLSQAVSARDQPSVERRAQAVRDAAGQAYSLMEALLAWASLQMDTAAVILGEVDLEGVAREIIAGSLDAAGAKALALRADCGGLRVRAHRDMLAAVLRNLVGNAVKFTAPGGAVAISGRRTDGGVEVSVSDTGVGIAPGKLDDLFRLDRRTTTKGTAGEPGSGLGLLLCRDLVERQGGTLGVESVQGRGTTFRFELPYGTDLTVEASNEATTPHAGAARLRT